jgi:hypothetical protein
MPDWEGPGEGKVMGLYVFFTPGRHDLAETQFFFASLRYFAALREKT